MELDREYVAFLCEGAAWKTIGERFYDVESSLRVLRRESLCAVEQLCLGFLRGGLRFAESFEARAGSLRAASALGWDSDRERRADSVFIER